MPDHLIVDRCYLHGPGSIDVREGVLANANHVAVVDSYISDIHQSTADSQAILAYASDGPWLIRNNYLSATTEDVMFGGAGGSANTHQPADIIVQGNYFYKPLEWAAPGVTMPPRPKWTEKNSFECKSCQRVLVEGNVMENTWVSGGQQGFSIVLTVRSGQSGDTAVVDDVTIQNNILKNVGAGFTTLASDNSCGNGYPNCKNPGESKRVAIRNNAIIFRDPAEPGGGRNIGAQFAYKLSDYEFSHNSLVQAKDATGKEVRCWNAIYFNVAGGNPWPPPEGTSTTTNIWVMDNALCKQPSGDNGQQGLVALERYMGQPSPVASRYTGNVMYVESPEKGQQWPQDNVTTTSPMTFTPGYVMTAPVWTQTTDQKQAGYHK
jgi:hypothetical protein